MRQRLRNLLALARSAAARVRVNVGAQFDLQDAFVFGGLACVAYGVAQIYPPAAWIVGGSALFWLGIRGS